jgi:hypothetical protein
LDLLFEIMGDPTGDDDVVGEQLKAAYEERFQKPL